MRTIKDTRGRRWEYNDAEGCWSHGRFTIGCAINNGSKWSNWNSADRYPKEFKTLALAMDDCYETEAN